MGGLEWIEQWPGNHAVATLAVGPGGPRIRLLGGDARVFPDASVTKVASLLLVLVEVAARRCRLDDPVNPPGSTRAHRLSHALGVGLEATSPIRAPGERRLDPTAGIELAAAHAATAGGVTPWVLVASRVSELLGRG